MCRVLSTCLAMGTLLIANAPAWAQEEATTTTRSWFKMFLWSDDFLGLLIIWLLLLMSAVSLGWSLTLILRYRRNDGHSRRHPESDRDLAR